MCYLLCKLKKKKTCKCDVDSCKVFLFLNEHKSFFFCLHRREVSAIVPISGRNFPTLFSGMQGTVWGIVVTPARGDGAALLLKWLQTSAGAFPQGVSRRKKEKNIKNTPPALWMKGPDLILALFLYIDEHESPLLWIASPRALGQSAGPRAQSYQ